MDFIGFILVVLFTVLFHELGHFWVARLFKMTVLEFSIGMGKTLLYHIDRHGTMWKLSLLPLGGYVRLQQKGHKAYEQHPVYQRFLMVFAGPLFSIVFGWVMFFAIFFIWGQPKIPEYESTGIYEILPDSPAQNTPLQTGDRIIQMANESDIRPIQSFYDLYMAVQHFKTSPVHVTVQRGDEKFTTQMTARAYKTDTGDIAYQIGVKGYPITHEKMRLSHIIYHTSMVTWRTMTIIYDAIIRIFTGNITREELGGPIRIADMAGDSLQMGIRQFMIFLGAFSINLGVFNLIPLPVLDGGRMVLLCAEGIMRKPLSTKVSHFLIVWSMAVVLTFLIFVTLIDIGIL